LSRIYQVPAILNDAERPQISGVNWERLAQFTDVRGIRIEDDVLVTESGNEVLAALPTDASAIEQQGLEQLIELTLCVQS